MATANELLADESISHAIGLTRYSNSVVRRVIQLLNRVDADLFARLREALERMPRDAFTVQRIDSLLVSVERLNAQAYKSIGEELDAELLALAGYEGSYQHKLIESVLPAQVASIIAVNAVSAESVHAAAMARPFQGKLLSESLAGVEAARAARIRDAIRMGFVEGDTIDQMVRRLRGSRANNYADGLLEVDRRGAESLVRTAVNHTANYARQALYEANADIVKQVQWISTLDGRTSAVCQARDGDVFPIDKGPRPPAHWGCRSSTVPVLASAWEALGLSKSEIEESTRASMDGKVSGATTYQKWLKGKPAEFQDEVLGPTKGKLFRKGGLSLDRFVNDKGREYSLDELRSRDAEAFRRVGL